MIGRLLVHDQDGLHRINLADAMPFQIAVCYGRLCQASMIAFDDPAFLKHRSTIVVGQHLRVTADRKRQRATYTSIAVLCRFVDIHD